MKSRRRTSARIDWGQLRERLARARQATEDALRLSPERALARMEERARILARVPPRAPDAAEVLGVVTFSLANERYAIETRHVREVVRPTEFTPVAGVPEFLVGLHNLRGDILAVFDLRRFFGVAPKEQTDHSRVLVLGEERVEFGILADAVHEVTALRLDEIHEPPGTVAGVGREYLRGVTATALLVLDGDVLLRDARLVIDEGEDSGG